MRLRKYFNASRKGLESISSRGLCKHLEYCACNDLKELCTKDKEVNCEPAKFYKKYGENWNKMYI